MSSTEERVAVVESKVGSNEGSIRRIENRQWAIMVTSIFTLVGVVVQIVI